VGLELSLQGEELALMNKQPNDLVFVRKMRASRGQAIVEGTAMLVVLTSVVAVLIACIVSTYVIGMYNLRLQAIAADGARQVAAYKWWLGMERPEYDQAAAEHDAQEAINGQLQALGMPLGSNWKFAYSQVLLRKKETTVVRLDFDVRGVRIGPGLFFPGLLTLHASGVSSDAEHAVTRHGQVTFHAEDPGNPNRQRAVRIPVYNATIGDSTPAHPEWLRAGPSAVGDYPTAYIRLECKTNGSALNKQQLNAMGNAAEITDRYPWGPND
jgi:hypothetical protein